MDGHDMLRELLPAVADDVRKEILKFQGKAFRTNYLSRVAPFPQVQPLFKAIKELGLKVGVATDCTADELRIYLERAGGHKQIDARACGDDVNRGKPHPDLLQHVLSTLSLSPRDMLYVGDTPYDVKAAQSLGIAAIGVTTGCFDAAALGSEGASFVVRGVGDLLAGVPGFAEHAPEL
jgi:phosphoglycolate phosphatase-like HAD superfamily hydrolase